MTLFYGFSEAWLRCPMRHKKWSLATAVTKDLMRHRHTVDLDIPRQVASPQSLTPLLQAR